MGILLAYGKEGTPFSNLIDIVKLDFSVESLKEVDKYLAKVRKKKLTEEEQKIIVLRCGTYLGEVIRTNSPKDFDWVHWDNAKNDFMQKHFARDLTTVYIILKKSSGNYLFPLAKVYKFIQNGKEDSLWVFAMWALDIKSERIAIFSLEPVDKPTKKDKKNV